MHIFSIIRNYQNLTRRQISFFFSDVMDFKICHYVNANTFSICEMNCYFDNKAVLPKVTSKH